jgi:uncharacterized heparinase superfamily protein
MRYQNILLYSNTLRYLRPSQFVARIAMRVRKKYAGPARYSRKRFPATPALTPLRNEIAESTHCEEWQGGSVYRFLNTTLDTQGNWFPPQASQLWIYNLHYFAYLYAFESWEQCRCLIQRWIDEVPVLAKDAWHPYTVSLRICNWIWAYGFFADKESAPPADNELCTSIFNQARYVRDFLERDVLGNHLVENCKALIVAGVFLGEPAFTKAGAGWLRRQLAEQILGDGGHYERSPMYHCIVLEDLIAVHDALAATDHPFAREVRDAITHMANFAYGTLEPDGTIALFNDSAYGIAPQPEVLFSRLEKQQLWRRPSRPRNALYKQSGLYVYRDDTISLTFDCGACCPDFLPAHAHADMLSYTLWFDGEPVVTDSGVYEYTAGQWRDYFRSTRAHNTFTIDDREQIACWAAFRVGRRGYPRNVKTTASGAYAETTCYHFLGVRASRTIELRAKQPGIQISDRILPLRKRCSYRSFVHFAPGVSLTRKSGSRARLQTKNGAPIVFEASPALTIKEEQSWYSPEFGHKRQRLCLSLSAPVAPGAEDTFWYTIANVDNLP